MPSVADPGMFFLPRVPARVPLVYSRPMTMDTNFQSIPVPIRDALAPLLAVIGFSLLYLGTAPNIQIAVGERELRVRTLAPTVAGVLRDAGLGVDESDRVMPARSSPPREAARIELVPSQTVSLAIDGEVQFVKTAQSHPANILAEMGMRILPGDMVLVDGLPLAAWPQGGRRIPNRIRVQHAEYVTAQIDGQEKEINARAPTLAQGLGPGLPLYEGDRASRPLSRAPISGFELHTSRPVTIEVDGRTLRSRIATNTVGAALADTGVVLLGLDRSSPDITAAVPEDAPIEVTRVREEVLLELEPVAFETRYEPLPEVEIDNRRIIDTGAYGVRANQVRIRYEDGEEVSRRVEGNWLAREPDPRVVGYGTNIVVRTMNTPDGTIEYWRAVEMWATSYSPSRAGVSPDAPNFGITASGRPLEKGLVAIDRSLIPFGTRMYVPGYGFALAADTGSGVKGRWIDLGYEDDNWKSWAQYVTVYFLTPVPPADNITWILP